MRSWGVPLVVAAVLCLAAPQAARAQAAKPPAGRWSLICPSFTQGVANTCRVTQRVLLKKTKALLMSASVRAFGRGKPPALVLHLPHGLYLPAGVALAIDGTAFKKLQYQTCTRRGCFASTKLDAAALARLKTGNTLRVVMKNLRRKDIKVTLSLVGFSGAYGKMIAN